MIPRPKPTRFEVYLPVVIGCAIAYPGLAFCIGKEVATAFMLWLAAFVVFGELLDWK